MVSRRSHNDDDCSTNEENKCKMEVLEFVKEVNDKYGFNLEYMTDIEITINW